MLIPSLTVVFSAEENTTWWSSDVFIISCTNIHWLINYAHMSMSAGQCIFAAISGNNLNVRLDIRCFYTRLRKLPPSNKSDMSQEWNQMKYTINQIKYNRKQIKYSRKHFTVKVTQTKQIRLQHQHAHTPCGCCSPLLVEKNPL